MERPHRAFELDIHIGANDWDCVLAELRYLADHIEQHGPECKSVSGSSSSGHTVTVVHRPEMTGPRYFADLDAYLRDKDAAALSAAAPLIGKEGA